MYFHIKDEMKEYIDFNSQIRRAVKYTIKRYFN